MTKEHLLRAMGTTIKLQVTHPQAERIIDKAVNQLLSYEKTFSANRPDSLLSQINQFAGIKPVAVDAELYHLIKLGKHHSIASNGMLNIAIGPLVQLWRIGFTDANLPDQSEIDEKLTLIDPRLIELDDFKQTVFLKKSGMQIDLGALAKGYFADQIIKYFKEVNVKSGMINLGGNLLTYGPPVSKEASKEWKVGIQDPKKPRGQNRMVIKTFNQSVVTSGIYERMLTINGKQYHHIFDSRTGYPMNTNLESLTIVSNKSIDGEIWTTRLFGLSPLEIVQTAEKIPHIEAIVMTNDRKILATPNIRSKIVYVSS